MFNTTDHMLMAHFSGSLLISHKKQRRLSGYGYIDVGLPPASPAASEDEMVSITLSLCASVMS